MVIFSFLIWFCSGYPSAMGAISCSISESESVLQHSETEKDAFLHPVFISYKFDEVVHFPCMRSCLRILSYAGAAHMLSSVFTYRPHFPSAPASTVQTRPPHVYCDSHCSYLAGNCRAKRYPKNASDTAHRLFCRCKSPCAGQDIP